MRLGRQFKISILTAAKAVGLFALSRARSRQAVRILCYHGVWLADDDFSGDAMFMSAQTFRSRLETIARLGYPVIPLSDAVDAITGRRTLDQASVAITIDDGWYSTYTAMLPELARHEMPATLYCDTAHLMSLKPVPHVMARYFRLISGSPRLDGDVADAFDTACNQSISHDERMAACRSLALKLGLKFEPFLAKRAFHYMSPEELVEAANAGLDVQLHTHNHTMHNQEPSEIFAEIDANRLALAGILDRDPSAFTDFCYPSGVCSPPAARAAERSGTRSATTTVQGLTWPGMDSHLLPRLLDGEQLSPIEFEAELSGFADILRSGRAFASRTLSRLPFYNRVKIGAMSWNHA